MRKTRRIYERRLSMSTHDRRRRGMPVDGEDARARRDDPRREPRFETASRDPEDVPMSPLAREQRDASARASALSRDRAAVAASPIARDWRSAVAVASALNVVCGLWLIAAPFVLSYGAGDPVWNDVLFGAVTAIIALARVTGAYGAAWLSRVNALVGAWIFAAAFWLDATVWAATNHVIVGSLVVLFALASATATDMGRGPSRTPPA
jgi:hypothetical protein